MFKIQPARKVDPTTVICILPLCSLPGAGSVSEALGPRAASRAGLDASGAKPKLSCPKDNWHGCTRKTSRGSSRTQRRRRSKSPILHPPKFTYCSSAAASALQPPSGCLKHQRLAVPVPPELRPPAAGGPASSLAQTELSPPAAPGHIAPLVFGSCAEYEGAAVSPRPPLKKTSTAAPSPGTDGGVSGDSSEDSGSEKSASEDADAPQMSRRADAAADFRALSELHSRGADPPDVPCTCAWPHRSDSPEASAASESSSPCRCKSLPPGWNGVEVYSFTGLRNTVLECEGSGDANRTLIADGNATSSQTATASSGSPRSCSEQARAYVDDITIEDLSGYMEFYLYIPKKMSHMAEMMYT
ncbi:oxidative stress-responsive serine-rich protein 1 [Etheostoma cragini]|uniref:oxidative stress-responsive serine-rich protein 1 n=1 Tax=Etheostoma cragini TaxID=417921 RepID=UPI00155E48EA|nr:oxidative stress-responsive serine-rich protein 1 [Etheostoma cragini]